MTYTYNALGDTTEIHREDDDAGTAVVIVPFLDSETPEQHQARVHAIVAGMNAPTPYAAVQSLHALVRATWEKGRNGNDPAFSSIVSVAEQVLMTFGQSTSRPFDAERVKKATEDRSHELDDAHVRAAAMFAGLEMAPDHQSEMIASDIGPSGDLARSIMRLQLAIGSGTEAETNAAATALENAAYALHREAASSAHEAEVCAQVASRNSSPTVRDILTMLRDRHRMRLEMRGDTNNVLALEIEVLIHKTKDVVREHADDMGEID